MGLLRDRIASIGYRFLEGEALLAVPTVEGEMEIKRLSVLDPVGQVSEIPLDNTPFLFPMGDSLYDGDLDNPLPEDIVTSCDAIYRDYYSLNDDQYSMLLYHCTVPMKAYLDSEKARIGLIGYKEGKPEGFFARGQYTIGLGIGEMDIGRLENEVYLAQSAQALFENASALCMYFRHLPDRQDVEDAAIIRKMERDFRLKRHKETFICSYCGQVKHWLDISGSLSKKLRYRLSRKCGCEQSCEHV